MSKQPDNIKNGKRISVMHGELWLQPIDDLPTGESTKHSMFVLAHSETGHHHVLQSDTEFTVVEGKDRSILLEEVATLFHQKTFDIHETRVIAPGAYKTYYKSEYDPYNNTIRQIWD